MKPLDLTKPVQTRDGRPARIICTDRKSDHYPILALLMEDGTEYTTSFTVDGECYQNGGENRTDLVNVPPKRTSRFYNAYENGDCFQHKSLDSAKFHADYAANATIECVFEDRKLVEVVQHG